MIRRIIFTDEKLTFVHAILADRCSVHLRDCKVRPRCNCISPCTGCPMCLVDILRIKQNVSLYKSYRYYPLKPLSLYFSHFFPLYDNSGAITSEHLIVTFPFSRETLILDTNAMLKRERERENTVEYRFQNRTAGENYSHSFVHHYYGRSACFIEREIYPL